MLVLSFLQAVIHVDIFSSFSFFFFYFSLQEQWEVVWSEPVGSDMLTERGSNSVEHCPGSNNTAGRRYTAAHCAAAEESALTRSAESAQRAQGASNNVLKWSFAAKSGNVSSKRRHNTDFHAAPPPRQFGLRRGSLKRHLFSGRLLRKPNNLGLIINFACHS